MDEFEEFVREHSLSDLSILERVDEYALYCFYLGYIPEIGLKHQSPLRLTGNPDEFSSFGIFVATKIKDREFMWKDHGTGKSGDIFRLIRELYGYSTEIEVYRRVDQDFQLGFSTGALLKEKIVPNTVRYYTEPVNIRTKARSRWYTSELVYWQNHGSSKPTLERYNVHPVEALWLTDTQTDPIMPKAMCFDYRIRSKHKIYWPYERKDRKFRNNLTEHHIEGFEQLEYNQNLLIITKSLKDVMCLRSFGYESIAARSENTVLPDDVLKYLENRYRHILVLFDNDGKHLAERYPYDLVLIPEETGEKDPSDHHAKYGRDKTGIVLAQIIGR